MRAGGGLERPAQTAGGRTTGLVPHRASASVSAPRPSGAPRPRGPGPHASPFRRQPHLEPHVQARVVLLDLVGAVLGSKLSHDPSDPRGIGDGACPDARPAPSCPETDRGDPPSVLVPLGLGSVHRKQIQPRSVCHEPHGPRALPARPAARHRDGDGRVLHGIMAQSSDGGLPRPKRLGFALAATPLSGGWRIPPPAAERPAAGTSFRFDASSGYRCFISRT